MDDTYNNPNLKNSREPEESGGDKYGLFKGLHAYIDKTQMMPVGHTYGITEVDKLCPDLNFKWVKFRTGH